MRGDAGRTAAEGEDAGRLGADWGIRVMRAPGGRERGGVLGTLTNRPQNAPPRIIPSPPQSLQLAPPIYPASFPQPPRIIIADAISKNGPGHPVSSTLPFREGARSSDRKGHAHGSAVAAPALGLRLET